MSFLDKLAGFCLLCLGLAVIAGVVWITTDYTLGNEQPEARMAVNEHGQMVSTQAVLFESKLRTAKSWYNRNITIYEPDGEEWVLVQRVKQRYYYPLFGIGKLDIEYEYIDYGDGPQLHDLAVEVGAKTKE